MFFTKIVTGYLSKSSGGHSWRSLQTDGQTDNCIVHYISLFVEIFNYSRKSRKLSCSWKLKIEITKQISEMEEKLFTSSWSIYPEACVIRRRGRGGRSNAIPPPAPHHHPISQLISFKDNVTVIFIFSLVIPSWSKSMKSESWISAWTVDIYLVSSLKRITVLVNIVPEDMIFAKDDPRARLQYGRFRHLKVRAAFIYMYSKSILFFFSNI